LQKILILEDEPNLSDLLKELLTIEGFNVLAPNSFDKINETVANFLPDAIIMDIHLGDIDGLKAIADIRLNPAHSDLYILALSGVNLTYEAKEAGANAFLQKPFMADEIINQLNQNIKS
jgi:DNA-binding response OmpR family regulator